MKDKKVPLVSLENVSKIYQMDGVETRALDNVSFKIFPQELISIIGASGSGKSTLLHLLGLLDRPTKGKIKIFGENVSNLSESRLASLRNKTVGFVFQQFNLLPRTSAWDNVMLPVWYNPILSYRSVQKRAKELFKHFGIWKRREHFSNQLSGGEQQRVAIIRALICEPELILADEPTGNLDSKVGNEIIESLVDLNKKFGKTLVLVSHDPFLVKQGKRKIYIKDGQIAKEEGSGE